MNKRLSDREQRARRRPRKVERVKCRVCARMTIVREGRLTHHVRKTITRLADRAVIHTEPCRGSHEPVERKVKPPAVMPSEIRLMEPEQILVKMRMGANW